MPGFQLFHGLTFAAILFLAISAQGLAPVMLQALEGVVSPLRAQGLGVLLVDQNSYPALVVADRVSVLEGGQIVHSAPIADNPAETPTRFLEIH